MPGGDFGVTGKGFGSLPRQALFPVKHSSGQALGTPRTES